MSFSIDPNFRAWTQGTQRLLWNAIVGPNPAGFGARRSRPARRSGPRPRRQPRTRPRPSSTSGRRSGSGSRAADATATAKILSRRGAEVARIDLGAEVLFLVANRKDLSAEESPLFDFIVRDLDKAGIDPLAASMP